MPPSRQPSRRRLVEQLGSSMQRYQRSVQAFDDTVGRHLGLGPSDLRCLDWLVDGPRTAGELSAATGLSPSSTTALIDRLVRRGFVRRVESSTDRRTVRVEMTETGRARTWEAYGPLVEAGRPRLERLTVEQLQLMDGYLREITELTDTQRELLDERGLSTDGSP